MTKAYSYIRFSTPEQAQGDSLRRQTAKAEVWAEERGLALDNTLRDLGVSAYHGANRTTGALSSFLRMVEDGRIERGSYLIVESLDRISRESVMDAVPRLLDLIRAGIIVVTLSDGQVYSEDRLRADWMPLMISLIVMARAHEESRIKSERVGEAWRQKKEAARRVGKPLTPRCPEWLEVRDGKFVERADRVEIVKRVFRETIEGFGRREIVSRLNGDGIPPFKAGERRKNPSIGWQSSSVAKIVTSRAVIGEYQPHTGTHKARNRQPDGEPIPDYYPRVIEDETFWRAQKALSDRRGQTAGRRGKAGAHILRGLGKCGTCSGPMHVINKGKPPKGGIYLRCDRNKRHLGCDNQRAWRVDHLEDAVIRGLGSIDIQAFASLDDATPKAEAKLDALAAEVHHLDTARRRLLELVETGDDAAVSRFKDIAESLKEKKLELKSAKAEAATLSADPDIVAKLTEATSISGRLHACDENGRHELRIRLSAILRTVIDRIVCSPNLGAVMVLRQRPVWKMNISGFAVRGEPTAIYVLLDSDLPNDVVNHFITDFGSSI